ncbi:DUF4199 domain-containing protein [Crocinitomicaceae bacterium]|jgi:amino acid transporter|nr:DUF4199 domain-containing protein [bacterium]MDC0460561.1 DUF4199 domain-containing protein [Crocinitomicaceae bacterium]
MRSIVKTGLYNSVIFAVIILLFLNPSRNNYSSADNIKLSILFTMFLITLGATISLYREKRKQKNQNSLKDDFKTALIPSMILCLLSSLFIYTYFEYVNPSIISDRLSQEETTLDSEANFKKFKSIEGNEFKTKEEFKKQGMENAKIGNAFSMSVFWLALSSFWSFINGIFLCVIFRRVIFRHHLETSSPPKDS